ncbi:outer membrane protein assembly factor BamB family protein [Sorangium sp. So ce145]|uniref:outer membrane protein assembly factor BamB family protein n=1 Tax=Sorangium sp. So ce145 TaxID=3133285 RepID=UPI003F62F022
MAEHIARRGWSLKGCLRAASALTITALVGLTACEPIGRGGGGGGAGGTGGSDGSPGASSSSVTEGAGGSNDGGAPGTGGDGGSAGTGGTGGPAGNGGSAGTDGTGGSADTGGAPGTGGDGGSTGTGGDGGSTGGGGDGGSTGTGGDGGSTGGGGDGGSTGGGGDGGSTGGGGSPGTCVPGSVVACYTGPAGTKGVGRCASGTQTCRPDGFGYGACAGEVTPARERCATPADESCDGEPHCAQPPAWARGFGGPGVDEGFSVASDASGNYYVSGTFSGTIDFGTGPVTSAGEADILFIKFDPSGAVLWSKHIGTERDERGGAVTVDENGNVFLTGVYMDAYGHSSIDLGGCALPVSDIAPLISFFVAQFDPDGNHIWSHGPYDFPAVHSVEQIAVDARGDMYVLYLQWEHAQLIKIDAASKATLWRERLPGEVVRDARLALDSSGNPVAVVTHGVSFEGIATRFVVSKYTPTGEPLWVQQFESSTDPVFGGGVTAHAVAIDVADEILVTGTTDGSVDFGSGPLPAGSVLLKLDAAGEPIFSRSVRFGDRIALDRAGDIVAAGRGLAKLDASGTELWSIDFDADAKDISLSPNGAIAATGLARGPVDFGTGPIPYGGANDAYIAVFNPPASGGDDDGGSGGAGSSGDGGGSAGGDAPATCVPGSVVACYTGPAGTRGVGRCAPGTQTCLPEGAGYGPCIGEVTPAAEVCVTPEDESCDGEPHCPPQPPWSRGYGGAGADVGWSIASDAAGNYYVIGTFEGSVDFGAGPLTSAGDTDVFLLKLDPAGALLWSKRFGSDLPETGRTLAVDGSGNVLLAGNYWQGMSAVSFGGCALQASGWEEAIFVAKLDPDGNHIWSQRSVASDWFGYKLFGRLAVDALGSAYVAFAPLLPPSTPSLAKLDPAGNILWTQPLATAIPSHNDYQHQSDNVLLAVDGAGDVITTSASISGQPSCPCPHGFTVQKLTPAGGVVWSRQFGPSDPSEAELGASALALALTADDEILLTAYTDGTVDFGGGVLPEGPVLVKLDAAGEHVFSRSIPFGDAIALDGSGGIVIAGDGLSRLDAAGTALWTSSFDASANDITVSPNGTIAITGAAEGPTDFGTGPIPHAAGADVFVATMSP